MSQLNLKIDLKSVKDGIQKGIQNVITSLEVETLDKKVRDDLKSLRGKIEGLAKDVDKDSNVLVKDALENLKKQKADIDNLTSSSGSIQKAVDDLDSKFKQEIQSKLEQKVTAVDSAIGTLGGKFSVKGDPKKLEGIFGHIKGQVGDILNGDNGDKGLQGIASAVKVYVTAVFANMGNDKTMDDWLPKILGDKDNAVNDPVKQPVKRWLEKYISGNSAHSISSSNTAETICTIKHQIKTKLKEAKVYENVKSQHNVQAKGQVATDLGQLKNFLEAYAKKLDEKLQPESGGSDASQFVDGLVKQVGNTHGPNTKNEYLTFIVEAILVAISAKARRAGEEIDSLLLNAGRVGNGTNGKNSIAEEIDNALKIAKTLNTQFEGATTKSVPSVPPGGQKESLAQAVDSKLEDVKTFVSGKNGDDNNITNRFEDNVIHELKQAVGGLEPAVTEFNNKAQAQIRAAANTAIQKAAEQFQMDGNGRDISVEKTMHKFHQAYDSIKKNLKSDLEQKVDAELPNAEGTNASTHVKLDDTKNFGSYNTYVTQNNEDLKKGELKGVNSEGKLPAAIGDIKTLGLAALKIIDPKGSGPPDQKITEATFTGAFDKIKTQLEDIKKLVDDDGFFGKDEKGVQKLLGKLKSALDSGMLDGAPKGLDEIIKAIDGLQKGPFHQQPAAIDSAISEIKGEIDILKIILKNDNKNNVGTNGVIDDLDNLKSVGLDGKSTWKNGVSGLGKIQDYLEKDNEKLPVQTDIIAYAILDIQSELGKIGIRLNHPLDYNDVIDLLGRLAQMIGQSKQGYRSNLKDIQYTIAWLQREQFTNCPQNIREANSAIKGELEAQMNTLNSGVIATLGDLKDKGLSEQASWKPNGQKEAKGFDHIISELNTQQGILKDQHPAIGVGVTQITGELTKLQTQLEKDVTEKLRKLKDHGLEKGEQPWNDSDFKTGLTQITAEIENIKTTDVKDVRDKLNELCTEIRTLAREAKRDLKHLKKIQAGI
ncbi:Extracellular matrix-binding ebh, putative [Babesia ovata]|uniref:Extracellular matrix-binding ebh, putative n=1 Tax=Babesia ovata TaxID=189622 RepID=A0A2H6KD99_9APIC|nr:Extracellular matrix-binding ebh, putative [Babesia ovata]GBE60929.1 Extracellular matrix-binding ebh, putative [Babesia ovata]